MSSATTYSAWSRACFDLVGPDGAAGDALGVEPGVEALFLQVFLQALGERGSVFAGVGDEDARWFRRWHWLTDHYEGARCESQG